METYGLAGVLEAKDIKPFDRLKLALTGEPGSGKSWTAATAPVPILVHDFDGRRESLAGKPGIQIIDYKNLAPKDRWPTFLTNLGMLEYKKKKGEEIPLTQVLDSATHASASILDYVLGNDASIARTLGKGTVLNIVVPRTYDGWMVDTKAMQEVVERLFALGHTIVTFHERPEETPDSKPDDKKFTGRFSIEPKRYKAMLSLFNEHWRCMPRGGKMFKVLCRPSGVFTAKTALLIDDEEDPDIQKIISKHNSRLPK